MITDELKKKCYTNTLITTIINTVFATVALVLVGLLGVMLSTIPSNPQLQNTYDATSYVDGYRFIGDLFYTGFSFMFEIVLGVLLIVMIIGFVLFLFSDIVGWITFFKLKKEEDFIKIKRKIKIDSIVKIIIAGIVIAVSISLLVNDISVICIIILVLQGIVGILAITNLKHISNKVD